MDLNEEFDNILIKYNLDKNYPNFSKVIMARRLIKRIVTPRGGNLQVFLALNLKHIEYFEQFVKDKNQTKFFLCQKGTMEFHDKIRAKKRYVLPEEFYKCITKKTEIYTISRSNDPLWELWLNSQGIKFVSLYDYFQLNGLSLTEDYISFLPNDIELKELKNGKCNMNPVLTELILQLYKYDACKNEIKNNIHLENSYFLSLVLRNFVVAKECINRLSAKNTDRYKIYLQAWQEIKELLKKIKQSVLNRKHKDYILYWIDNVPYENLDEMVFLHNEAQKGIDFTNTHAITPYTVPACKNIFLTENLKDGKRENSINEASSILIKEIQNKGYEFKIISGVISKLFAENLRAKPYFYMFTPASLLLWESIVNLFDKDVPMFLLVHLFTETHHPMMVTKSYGYDFFDHFLRYREGKKEADQELSWYNQFLNENITRIYLSDHGMDGFYKRFHTFLIIRKKNTPACKVNAMLSIDDYSKIFCNLLNDKSPTENIKKHNYLRVYDVPWRNIYSLKNMIKNRNDLLVWMLGFQGIIDNDYIYFKFNNGTEWLQKRKDALKIFPYLFQKDGNIVDYNKLMNYRELIDNSNDSNDINSNSISLNIRVLSLFYEKALKRNKTKYEILNKIFSGFPIKSVILRFGGKHTLNLYSWLTPANKEKISCIVDKNEHCPAQILELPIYPPDEINFIGQEAIICSTFLYRDMWENEKKNYPCNIKTIDLYEEFTKNGIICKRDFFYYDADESDYLEIEKIINTEFPNELKGT